LKLAKEQKNALNNSFKEFQKSIQNEVQDAAKVMLQYERQKKFWRAVSIIEFGMIIGGTLYMIVR
jgi:hypothetical protein